ncbi:hypothetical protein HO133_000320 [Letharia lupina]|uniref:Fork-head domain-containing protein n=1 Tax=Letharia lupina TaxID=560253 RepID=A0A8H6FCK9_9LECA|nr:uncharacterized protein HO133_000320 [Letharia lupina]KAF6223477.1 hypothetical protein HO133_000320 [Letharia lupina]
MASTRRPEIYQDPSSASDNVVSASQPSYDLMSSVFSDEKLHIGLPFSRNIVFNPPISRASGRSPLKPVRQQSSSPPKALYDNQANISLPPPQAPVFTTDSPLKRPTSSAFHPIVHLKPLKPIFTTFQSNASADKENFTPTYHSDNVAEFPDPSYGYKAPLKRILSNAAPLHDRQAKKNRSDELSAPEIPEPQNMPLIEDDGRKPQYSYAALIGMSILRAPGRRLTLAQIYKWISDSFAYYRASQTGWQNSIRHNLSLNKAFIKQERPKDDPGKGNYWAIEPGMETQFIKDKASRRPTSSSGTILKSSSLLSSEASIWSSQPQPPSREVGRVTEATEPSSDATIPASDAPSQEDEIEEILNMPPPASRLPLSPPLQPIHSSPPLPRPLLPREDTPSPVAGFPLPSSNSRSRRGKLAAMDDSGYFSSLDSSATRPFANPMLPSLTADRPRIKRGRAEEEIARIRSSSHDVSPSKGRAAVKQSRPPVSSSPLRHFDSSLMLPPLTPAVRFKLPAKPPASISPNTNLRNHRNKIRELVGSPVKNTSLFNEGVSFSPAFNIVDEEHYLFNDDFDTSFNIFRDDEHDYRRRSSSSPARRSVRRPRTERASRTATVLADVTGTTLNSKGLLSNAKAHALESPLAQKSSQNPLVWESKLDDVSKEELFGLEYDDEEPDDFGGVDILQGFQKIGGNQHTGSTAQRVSRPNLGARIHTGPSRF